MRKSSGLMSSNEAPLIPVVALVPTFAIARVVPLCSAAGPTPAPSSQEGDAWMSTPSGSRGSVTFGNSPTGVI